MKWMILSLVLVLSAAVSAAETVDGKNPLDASQKMLNWVSANLDYPTDAIANAEQGIVYVSFTVNADGTLENVEIAQGISQNLDNAVLKLVSEMPVNELLENNQNQASSYILPVKFVIR